MRVNKKVIVIGVLAGLVLLVIALQPRTPQPPVVVSADALFAPRSPDDVGSLTAPELGEAMEPREDLSSSEPETPEAEESALPDEDPQLSPVTIEILSEEQLAPCPELDVVVVLEEQEGAIPGGRTDEAGLTEVMLPMMSRSFLVHVRDPEARGTIGAYAVERADRVRILIPEKHQLKGRVVTDVPLPDERTIAWHVSISSRGADGRSSLFYGIATVAESGEFSAPTRRAPPIGKLEYTVFRGENAVHQEAFGWEQAISAHGVEIRVDGRLLHIEVVEEDGRAIPEVKFRLVCEEAMGNVFQALTCDEAGIADLLLPRVEVEACFSKPGFDSRVLTIHPTQGRLRVELREADDSRTLHGHVLDATGQGVEEALVSAYPITANLDITVEANAQVMTAWDGSFSVAIDWDGLAAVVACHRTLGLSPEVRIPVDGRSVEIWMEPVGEVIVRPRAAGFEAELQNAGCSWVLVDLERNRSWDGSWNWPPYEIWDVPIGNHRLFLCYPGAGYFASEDLGVVETGPNICRPWVRPGAQLSGEIVGADREDLDTLTFAAFPPNLPEGAAEKFCRTKLDAEGRFTLFVPTEAGSIPCTIVETDGSLRWSGEARPGELLRIEPRQ